MLRRLTAALAAGCLATTLSSATSMVSAPTTQANRPALAGTDHARATLGVFPGPVSEDIEANVNEWTTWIGRRPDTVLANQDVRTWNTYTGSCNGKFLDGGSLPGNGDFRRIPDRIAITFGPLVAEASSPLDDMTAEGTQARRQGLQLMANGDFDDIYVDCAEKIIAAGHADAVIRVMHEPEIPFYPWNGRGFGGEPDLVDEYIAAFRHVVNVLRTVPGQGFTFEYSMNGGPEQYLEILYPGDDVVDIIGQDRHEANRPIAENIARLQRTQAFAASRGKAFSIPEWSVSVNSSDYVQAVFDFLSSLPTQGAGRLEYHGYFQWSANGHLDQYPLAKQRFLEVFGE